MRRNLFLIISLLVLWGLPSAAFPIKFSPNDDGPRFSDRFLLGVLTIDPTTLEVGDTIDFVYALPIRTVINSNFYSENQDLPDYLFADNEGSLPYPVQNYKIQESITYTVTKKPEGTNKIQVKVWGVMDSKNFVLGQGLSRITVVKCPEQ